MIKYSTYTINEVEFLRDNYAIMPWEELIETLHQISGKYHSKTSIISKASSLGLKRTNTSYSNFTKEEDELIRELYETTPDSLVRVRIKELVETKLPHRTVRSVMCRATRIGARVRYPWTNEEDDYLRMHYYDMSIKELTEHFKLHSRESVYNRVKHLGLEGAATFAYTDAEIALITSLYLTTSDEEIAKQLHRTPYSVKEMRHKLGLLKPKAEGVFYGLGSFTHRNNADWKKESAKNCNYRCVISGDSFDDIHHLYSRNSIISDMFRKHPDWDPNINFNDLPDCTKKIIAEAYYNEQSLHPLGVCLRHDLHKQFHDKYGYGDNTPSQFYQFVKDIAPDKLDNIMNL